MRRVAHICLLLQMWGGSECGAHPNPTTAPALQALESEMRKAIDPFVPNALERSIAFPAIPGIGLQSRT